MLAQHLGKPLTKVPDPFGTHPSFGEHNNARLRAFLDTFGFEYEFLSSTRVLQVRPVRRDAAQGAGALRRGDGHHAAVAARGARADLFAVPADHPAHRHRAAGAGAGARRQAPAPSPTRIRTRKERGDGAGHRRALQAAMEAGLGDALGRARHRLRDGRQGPDRFGEAVRRDLPRARRHAAGGLQLRAVPRREGPEDFQVEGQRPDHRRMAALRQPGEPVAVHVSRAEGRRSGSTSTSSRATSTSISSSSTATSGRTASSACPIRSGTSIPASRRRPTCRSRSRCC